MHKLKVASRAQNRCFAPYLQPWERHRSQNFQGHKYDRARAKAHLKLLKQSSALQRVGARHSRLL
jgi:hypothetical protein